MTEKTPDLPTAAVALKYDGKSAPRVTASGEDEIAQEILRIARLHEVPIYENPELAQLLARLPLGDEIPDTLYRIVAEIIAFAFYIQGKVPDGFTPPETPPRD